MNANSIPRERTSRRENKHTNTFKPYHVRCRSPILSEDSKVNSDTVRHRKSVLPLKECKYTITTREVTSSTEAEAVSTLPPVVDLNRFIFPQTELLTVPSLDSVKLGTSVLQLKDKLFDSLSETDITNKSGYKRIQVDWTDTHLQVVPGVNLLAMCKNDLCNFYFQNVICPRGLYPERNGYCPMDRELFMMKCPICKLPIRPDGSIGIGFYRCEFKVTCMLRGTKSRSIELSAAAETLVYAKIGKSNNEKFLYLEINVGAVRSWD